VIEEPECSLSALLRAPLSRSENTRDGLSFDVRAALRAWLIAVLRDIHRALAHVIPPPQGEGGDARASGRRRVGVFAS
jgi:hypothetical protein